MSTRRFEVAGLEGGRVGLTSVQLGQLSAQLEGPLLTAGDEGDVTGTASAYRNRNIHPSG